MIWEVDDDCGQSILHLLPAIVTQASPIIFGRRLYRLEKFRFPVHSCKERQVQQGDGALTNQPILAIPPLIVSFSDLSSFSIPHLTLPAGTQAPVQPHRLHGSRTTAPSPSPSRLSFASLRSSSRDQTSANSPGLLEAPLPRVLDANYNPHNMDTKKQ
jgi:hypothetical protein